MPVGLIAFEIGSESLVTARVLKEKLYTEGRENISRILSRSRPNTITLLLLSIAVYLILSRCGPVVTRVGESTFRTLDLHHTLLKELDPVGIRSLSGIYKVFRGVTRVPGPFSRRSFSVVCFVMGTKQSKNEGVPTPKDEQENSEHSSKDVEGSTENPIKFSKIENDISTGDLAILKRAGQDIRHFAIFIQHDDCDTSFPLLLVKGKTKPMAVFDPKVPRHAHAVSAATRIFYGDYEMVSVRSLASPVSLNCRDALNLVDKMAEISFSELEIETIKEAKSDAERSSIVCTFMVAHFYEKMGVLKVKPESIRPNTLENELSLKDPKHIKLPKVKEGPLCTGDPPFLSRLVDGIFPPPDVQTVSLSSIANELNTGDLILFSGATSSGAIIKFFDHSLFSHIAIVIRSEYASQLLVWEASTNKAGLVDVESGKVRKGVELLPLRQKIFSGWYDRVAIRRLTEIDPDKRKELYRDLLEFRKEVQGRPYEKSKTELILSAIDAQEEYLSFLRNTKEDLSSLFCSELVAAAYMRMNLIDKEKLSNEYTPDDFATSGDLKLKMGKLEKEEYIELKFDYLTTTGTL